VRPADNALDYWREGCKNGQFGVMSRVAALAVNSGHQIMFDTTNYRGCDDPKGTMLAAARHMYDEAHEVLENLAGLQTA
jgi:hypothetical protein